jgi:uncharacterized protein YqhQ
MPYSADFALSGNATFQNQVQMAMTKAAVQVSSEARTLRNIVDQKRNALAVKILNNPLLMLQQFTFAAIETGLTGTPTDAQVDVAISSVWNGIAGVTPQDLA